SRRAPSLAFKVYAAGAFAALFCGLFLLCFSGVWWATIGVASQLQAMTVAAPVSDADGAFGAPFKWLASSGMSVIAIAFAYGYVFGHRRLRVSHVDVEARGTCRSERPLTIVHLSDIHLGQNLPVAKIDAFVASVNELDPDLVCITSDIID